MTMFFITLISRTGQLIITAADLVLGRCTRTSLMSAGMISSGDIHAQVEPIIRRQASLMLVDTLDSLVGFFRSLTVISSLKVMTTSHGIVVDI